jgi:hypothetical protein
MAKPDGLKPLSADIADAMVRVLAMLPDPARDERLFLRPAEWSGDGTSHEPGTFYVYWRGKRVGYVLHSTWYGTKELPWVWGIDGTRTIGIKAASRDEAMAGFRKAWDAIQNANRTA